MNKIPTSKKLTWAITGVFIATLLGGIVLKCFEIDVSEYVNIALIAESVVLGSYFGKSGFENVTSIKKTNNEGSEM